MKRALADYCPQQPCVAQQFQRPVYVSDFASKRSGSFASLRMTGFLQEGGNLPGRRRKTWRAEARLYTNFAVFRGI